MGAAGVLCFVGMMIAVGVGVKNKPTSQIICGSGIRTAGNTAKQLDASLRKGGLGTGTKVEVACDGADEQEALDALVALIESGFGE